jgi:hypothetical protein
LFLVPKFCANLIRYLDFLLQEIGEIESAAASAANSTRRAQSEKAQMRDFAEGLKFDAGQIWSISSGLRLQYGSNTTNTTQSITERTKCNPVNTLCVRSAAFLVLHSIAIRSVRFSFARSILWQNLNLGFYF